MPDPWKQDHPICHNWCTRRRVNSTFRSEVDALLSFQLPFGRSLLSEPALLPATPLLTLRLPVLKVKVSFEENEDFEVRRQSVCPASTCGTCFPPGFPRHIHRASQRAPQDPRDCSSPDRGEICLQVDISPSPHHEVLALLVQIVCAGGNCPLSILCLTQQRINKGNVSLWEGGWGRLWQKWKKLNLISNLSVLALSPLHTCSLEKGGYQGVHFGDAIQNGCICNVRPVNQFLQQSIN